MENHPIPQDVTGFQFKLVGNMTLKQFGYVGAGVILCVICYYAPVSFLIKLPFFILSALGGVGLAFIPIEGRPMDLMVSNFTKAIMQPNQFVYHKMGGALSFNELDLQPIVQQTPAQLQKQAARQPATSPQKEARLRDFLYDMSSAPQNSLDEKEAKYLSLFAPTSTVQPGNTVPQFTTPQAMPMQPNPLQQIPNPQPAPVIPQSVQTPAIGQPPQPMFQYTTEQQAPAVQNQQPTYPNATAQMPQQIPEPIQMVQSAPIMQPQPVLSQAVAQPISQPVQQLAPIPMTPIQNPIPQPVPQPMQPPVLPVQQTPQAMPQESVGGQVQQPTITQGRGIPSPSDFPNVITGVVKDSRGNVLPGILIEVKNKDGESVRAFKTNALGQFASATQMTNGVYTIEFEDPKALHKFIAVPIEANGTIITPLEVISVDAREELRRELFA